MKNINSQYYCVWVAVYNTSDCDQQSYSDETEERERDESDCEEDLLIDEYESLDECTDGTVEVEDQFF